MFASFFLTHCADICHLRVLNDTERFFLNIYIFLFERENVSRRERKKESETYSALNTELNLGVDPKAARS